MLLPFPRAAAAAVTVSIYLLPYMPLFQLCFALSYVLNSIEIMSHNMVFSYLIRHFSALLSLKKNREAISLLITFKSQRKAIPSKKLHHPILISITSLKSAITESLFLLLYLVTALARSLYPFQILLI